ncbi:MAG: hypothetical protein ACR2RV_15210 [Verrucomicrobiales bacterium]
MKTKTAISILACAATIALNSACGKKGDTETSGSGGGNSAGIPASLVAATAPEGALGVVPARAAAQPGQAIVVRGKVGGNMKPISDSNAILVLADLQAIKSCDEIPGDECETPWDFCCEETSTIAASTATIQVLGEDGKVARSTLRGVGDIKELSFLVVAGTVDANSTPDRLIVNADKIHVEKP